MIAADTSVLQQQDGQGVVAQTFTVFDALT
jgi:hypothetical protein